MEGIRWSPEFAGGGRVGLDPIGLHVEGVGSVREPKLAPSHGRIEDGLDESVRIIPDGEEEERPYL